MTDPKISESLRMRKIEEEALHKSNLIFHHAIDMLCIAGFDGYFKTINPSWTRVLGWSAEELTSKPFIEFVHPEDRKITENARSELKDGLDIYQFENRYLCKDGSWKWLSWKSYPDPKEEIIYGVARDITANKTIENKLRESEERFRGLFENNHAVMLMIDPENGNIIEANPAAANYYGYSRDTLRSMNISQINTLPPEELAKEMQTAVETKRNQFYFKHTLADGSIRDVEVFSGRVVFEGKAFLYSIVHDNMERKNAEEALRLSEAKYRLITENSWDVIWVLNLDLDRYTYFSPSIYQLRGLTPEEAMNESLRESLTPDSAPIVMEKIRKFYPKYLENKEEGRQLTEFRQPCKDGRIIWVESATRFRSNEKGETEILGVTRNIDERKKMEEEIQCKANFQKLVAEISTDFINATPRNIDSKIDKMLRSCGEFMELDRTYLFQFTEDEQVMSNTHEWCGEGIESIRDIFQNFRIHSLRWLEVLIKKRNLLYVPDLELLSEEQQDLRNELIREKVKSVLILPLIKNNLLLGYFGFDAVKSKKRIDKEVIELLQVLANILSDALEKNRMDLILQKNARELTELNTTKDKLFSIIAHDLRSPFNSFIGLTELMAQEDMNISPEEMRKYSGMLHQLAKTNFELLENLLEWSRLQRGLLQPELATVQVRNFIEECIQPFADACHSKKLTLEIEAEDSLRAHFDEKMINTVLRNLLANAIKYTPSGGHLRIRAEKPSQQTILFSLSDSGIGIPRELIPDLFTVNDKKNRPGINGERSTGLGLMLCKEFVDLHRGKIRVESQEQKGSIFYVELPQPE